MIVACTSHLNRAWNRIIWQKDGEGCSRLPRPGPGFESEMSSMSFDDLPGYPQTQSCPDILVDGKEWLEQLRAVFSIDAATGICDCDSNTYCPAAKNCIYAVVQQVRYYLPKLAFDRINFGILPDFGLNVDRFVFSFRLEYKNQRLNDAPKPQRLHAVPISIKAEGLVTNESSTFQLFICLSEK